MKSTIIFSLIISCGILFSCSKDSSSPSKSTSNTTSGNANYPGTFSGTFSYIEKDKNSGLTTDSSVTAGIGVTISGTSPNFNLVSDADPNSTLILNTSGSSWTGSNGTGEFSGTTYSGMLDGDVFTLNGTGSDANSNWTETYTATRTGSGNSNAILGDYSGTETYKEYDQNNNLTIDDNYPNVIYTISSVGGGYQMIYDDMGQTSVLNISLNGSNFSGSNGTNEFAGSSYSGTISGNTLSFTYTGSDASSSWNGSYSGTKSSGGGGGNTSNSLSIPGESNTGLSGIVDCQTNTMEAVFGTSDQDFWYDVEIGFDQSVDQLSQGNYTVVEPSKFPLSPSECYFNISHQDFNSGQVDAKSYSSISSAGTITISLVNGKVKASGTGIQMINDANPTIVKSVNVTLSCP